MVRYCVQTRLHVSWTAATRLNDAAMLLQVRDLDSYCSLLDGVHMLPGTDNKGAGGEDANYLIQVVCLTT
jgi:hypothetical protein